MAVFFDSELNKTHLLSLNIREEYLKVSRKTRNFVTALDNCYESKVSKMPASSGYEAVPSSRPRPINSHEQ